MLEFFAEYGAQIATTIISLASLSGSIYGITRIFKSNKTLSEKVQITREGIVEAFKVAKIPTEWKISVSKQIDSKLSDWRDEFLTIVKQNEMTRTILMTMILKILNYTAASNKLTEEEKAKINELIRSVSEEDATLDIND